MLINKCAIVDVYNEGMNPFRALVVHGGDKELKVISIETLVLVDTDVGSCEVIVGDALGLTAEVGE